MRHRDFAWPRFNVFFPLFFLPSQSKKHERWRKKRLNAACLLALGLTGLFLLMLEKEEECVNYLNYGKA